MTPRIKQFWRLTVLLLYLMLTCYQLGLPGLHYDEAKEAGVNALELLTGAQVTAFRGATVSLAGYQLPLMVQDYIGALNVYLALPLLKLTGIGVPNLRFLSVLTGLVTLLLLEKVVDEWGGNGRNPHSALRTPHSALAPGLITITLLAASPSFVFWSRQGIFVTNLTQPLVYLCLWQGMVWLRSGRNRSLLISAFTAGFALYAKLLAFWVIVPFLLFVGAFGLKEWKEGRGFDVNSGERVRGEKEKTSAEDRNSQLATRNSQLVPALFLFLLALSPFLWFNWQTGGTFLSVGGNLAQSYYGVNNLDIGSNLAVRWAQIGQVLRGDQFDYLGGTFANWLAPWLAAIGIAGGLLCNWRLMLPPILLLLFAFVASLFTVSGLFITHYALLQPLLIGLIALSYWVIIVSRQQLASRDRSTEAHERPQSAIRNSHFIIILLFFCFDLTNSIRYHRTLSQSGGLGDHSDASYHLAYHLRYNGLGAPIALDWGMDAIVRYLSEGSVRPIEIFGYESIDEPDSEFASRLESFLDNPDNTYLLRSRTRTVFAGRRTRFVAEVEKRGLQAVLEKSFTQRDGEVLFELWRVVP